MNSSEGTQYNGINNTESVLDPTLLSSSIAGTSTWSVKKTTIGSDHYPSLTIIGSEVSNEKIRHPGRK